VNAFATRCVVLGLLLVASANSVWAHAFLEMASPPVGSQSPVSPADLTLRFTEPVEPLFSTIQLLGPSGLPISVAAPKPIDNAQALVVALPKLQAGTYTVVWHVTSVDTHKTEGRFQFSVGP